MTGRRPPILSHVRRGDRQQVGPTFEEHAAHRCGSWSPSQVPVEVLDQFKVADFHRLSEIVGLHGLRPFQRTLVEASLHPCVHVVGFAVPGKQGFGHRQEVLNHTMVGFHGRIRPVHARGRVGSEEDEQPYGVCTVLLNHHFGRHRVAQRFAHFRAALAQCIAALWARSTGRRHWQSHCAGLAPRRRFVDHALAEQALEWFVHVVQPKIAKGLGPEACVDEVHLSVFNATTVEIDVHPAVGHLRIETHGLVVGVGIPQEVPRGVHEGVHRVGLALRGFATGWAGHLKEGGRRQQGIPRSCESHVTGQYNGKVLFRDRYNAARRAVDDRDRRAPIPLARHQPRTNFPVERSVACLSCFKGSDDRLLCFVAFQSIETVLRRVDHRSKVFEGLLHRPVVALWVGDDTPNGQAARGRKFEVTLVVTGDGHHRARAVGCDDEISEPQGDAFARQRVDDVEAGENALLLLHLLDAVEF